MVMGKKNKRWVDVTLPIDTNMISWPTDPLVKILSYKKISNGDSSNVLLLKMGTHTGTHIDAPRHFSDNGIAIDKMSLNAMMGLVRVIEIKDGSSICVDELRYKNLRPGQRIFFKTKNSKLQWWKKGFSKDFVFLTLAAAKYLVSQRVKLAGIDCLSIGGYGRFDAAAVHKVLLSCGIWIVEGLDLTRIKPGCYDMLCLPLRIYQADAAPARVFLRELRLNR